MESIIYERTQLSVRFDTVLFPFNLYEFMKILEREGFSLEGNELSPPRADQKLVNHTGLAGDSIS